MFSDLFIFEMANNHQGSIEHGKTIIEAASSLAKKYDVKAAVKFQFRSLDTFIHPKYRGDLSVKHIGRFESTRLSRVEFEEMVSFVKKSGLICVATPFDEESVQLCMDLDIEIIKVASCSACDWPLLECIARAQRPVIASSGSLDLAQIDNLVTFFTKRVPKFALLHCIPVYPTPPSAVNLNFMSRLMRRYPHVAVGYSGHEPPSDTLVVSAAIAKGAQIIERHFGVPTESIKLNAYSLNPTQAEESLHSIQNMRKICGTHDKFVSHAERTSIRELQRAVYAKRQILKGTLLKPGDVFFAMPCLEGQLTSGEFGEKWNKFIASKDYEPNDPVFEEVPYSATQKIRKVVHNTRGLLYEANIFVGEGSTLEVSHHYGMECFDDTGCVLINSINREYCNKFIIMFPGQKHPEHFHKQKEETFHLLWGDLNVNLDGKSMSLQLGEKLMIARERPHSFSTSGGCIFAEISTRSIPGDSFYTDPVIAGKDLLERKTVVQEW